MAERKKFIYRERTVEDAKKYIERSRFISYVRPGFDQFQAPEGDSTIRILPPTWDDHDHYAYPLHLHGNIGPDNAQYLCLRKHFSKPCPVCEEYDRLHRAGDTEEAKAIRANERFACWLIERDGKKGDNPLFYSLSTTVNAELLTLAQDKKKGGILMIDHPDQGFDISFRRTGKTFTNTKYSAWRIDREASPIVDNRRRQEEILDYIMDNPIPSVLKFFSYEHIKNALMGGATPDDEDRPDRNERRGRATDDERTETRDDDRHSGGKYTERDRHPPWKEEDDDEEYTPPHERRGRASQDDDEINDERESSGPVSARRIVRK